MTTTQATDLAADLRTRIPALAAGAAHFDAPGGTQTPREVATAIADTLLGPLANRGTSTLAERNAENAVAAFRAAMADLLGGVPAGVVVGRSTTQNVMDVSRALSRTWGPDDEVVVTRLDHDANVRPWLIAAQRVGATHRFADFDPATGELTPEHVAAQLGPRTRLVAVTAASNLIGTMPDVAGIARVVHDAGALLAVDGVHYTAHEAVDVAALGADLYFCSPYKFLGPHCGVWYADPAFLDGVLPDKLAPSTMSVPERFELGTLPYEVLAGVTAAVDVLAGLVPGTGSRRERLLVSMAAVGAHEDRLRGRIESTLRSLPGTTVWSNAARRTPTLLATFAGHDAGDVQLALAARGVNAPAGNFYAWEASHRLGLGAAGGLRIGLAPYNDDSDVDRLIDGLVETVV